MKAGPRLPPGSCSVQHDLAATPAWGTAMQARFWVALEQNGPWGRNAPTDSRLDPKLGARLAETISRAGGRFLLIRRPGARPDRDELTSPRRVFIGYAGASPWLFGGQTDDPAIVGGLDPDALGTGDRDAVHRSAPWLTPADPVLLVCTNGRRDVCCAVRARPVVQALAITHPDLIWECSHTGGHRFAPTGVLLPWGRMLARLDASLAGAVLSAAADGDLAVSALGPKHDRGCSALPPPAQAAEAAVRHAVGEPSLTGLTTAPPEQRGAERWLVTVRHTDGREWHVEVARESAPALPGGCGKAAQAQSVFVPAIICG